MAIKVEIEMQLMELELDCQKKNKVNLMKGEGKVKKRFDERKGLILETGCWHYS